MVWGFNNRDKNNFFSNTASLFYEIYILSYYSIRFENNLTY